MSGCSAIIVAAGRGSRFGGDVPKQYTRLAGQAILRQTVLRFLHHDGVDNVRVVIHRDDQDAYTQAIGDLPVLDPVTGGETRQESVRLGLESLTGINPKTVLIHDAARPFAGHALIKRVTDALETHPGAIPAVAVNDTLKRGHQSMIAETVARENLWRAQTPQGFRFQDILTAHQNLRHETLTDDASLMEKMGLAVALVEGEENNFKITTADDLTRAENMMNSGDIRTGYGFDVHRFEDGDHVMLCGVPIPHNQGLAGHSDADVGLHALTDALLGAAGEGDIGIHFPPSDERWRGAPSDIFLAKARDLVTAKSGIIINADITLICEQPKVSPHRITMCKRIAQILQIDPSRVNIKGTTTEGLGFTGRGEGIAAQAVITICLKA
ncbi:MAG: bifunctional 2-C-methyl-D-erythritol 4-phosphate cytidylyltransferase/2-C-methyl-D-erythritol 2,4-cyclodiphosphate synthase [Rhodospirillaceae bacterium]|jgi:2-C-methyl-D-erythritol 4-phosphate cytidylyltransferase/2-C-methyl-D-erythritol 2,4-cyclodiphosphate synthase